MSNVREEPDWWLGADGKWYPPTGPGTTGATARSETAGRAAASAGGLCPHGHAATPGANYCGTCGAPVGGGVTTPCAWRGARAPTSVPAGYPLVGQGYSPAGYAPTNRPGGGSVWATRSPLALVVTLGAVIVGMAPLLTWLTGIAGSSNLFGLIGTGGSSSEVNQAWPIVIVAAAYTVGAVALVLPLSSLRPAIAGSVTAVVTAGGLAAAALGAVSLYRSLAVPTSGLTVSDLGSGPWVCAVGMLIVVIGSIVYAASGRRQRWIPRQPWIPGQP